jgi:hypothetical protein
MAGVDEFREIQRSCLQPTGRREASALTATTEEGLAYLSESQGSAKQSPCQIRRGTRFDVVLSIKLLQLLLYGGFK